MSHLPAARRQLVCAALCAVLLAGCAFDVISIRQVPANFQATPESPQAWALGETLRVRLREGHASVLMQGTNWRQVGRIDQGDVFRTTDQIVFVEASNQHEAQLVVSKSMAVGFYLPVEHTFTAADPPTAIKTTPK
jgi:uncharacterized lipoprotein